MFPGIINYDLCLPTFIRTQKRNVISDRKHLLYFQPVSMVTVHVLLYETTEYAILNRKKAKRIMSFDSFVEFWFVCCALDKKNVYHKCLEIGAFKNVSCLRKHLARKAKWGKIQNICQEGKKSNNEIYGKMWFFFLFINFFFGKKFLFNFLQNFAPKVSYVLRRLKHPVKGQIQ